VVSAGAKRRQKLGRGKRAQRSEHAQGRAGVGITMVSVVALVIAPLIAL
jgi:hypothetical protein